MKQRFQAQARTLHCMNASQRHNLSTSRWSCAGLGFFNVFLKRQPWFRCHHMFLETCPLVNIIFQRLASQSIYDYMTVRLSEPTTPSVSYRWWAINKASSGTGKDGTSRFLGGWLQLRWWLFYVNYISVITVVQWMLLMADSRNRLACSNCLVEVDRACTLYKWHI